jgi:hypothetical protein
MADWSELLNEVAPQRERYGRSTEADDMAERQIYRDAWRIAEPGAVNPVAVAGTLAAASSALLHRIGTDGVKNHPALRVMAGQLAMLYNVSSLGADIRDYNAVQAYTDTNPVA